MVATWGHRHRALIWLALGVLLWWLVAFEVVMRVAPPLTEATQQPVLTLVLGSLAAIQAPPGAVWPIPNDRQTHEDYWAAIHADEEGKIDEVLLRPGWVTVADCQRVQLVDVDGENVQVKVLAGSGTGGHGWLKRWQLKKLCPQ